MAIEKKGAAEAGDDKLHLLLEGAVVGMVGIAKAPLELLAGDRLAPQMAVSGGPRRNDPEPPASPRSRPCPPVTADDRRVDLVLGAIAIDCCPWRPGDHRPRPLAHGAPDESIDQRVFERRKRRPAMARKIQQPAGVIAAGVRNREHDGQLPALRMNDWGRE